MVWIYSTPIFLKGKKMYQVIGKIDNLIEARGFKNKKDAINYLREDYLESIYPFLEINCHGKREKYSFKDHLNQFKIIKVNDSISISEQV